MQNTNAQTFTDLLYHPAVSRGLAAAYFRTLRQRNRATVSVLRTTAAVPSKSAHIVAAKNRERIAEKNLGSIQNRVETVINQYDN